MAIDYSDTQFIKDRDRRYEIRNKKKENFDKLINLGCMKSQVKDNVAYKLATKSKQANNVRLLDEGLITYGDGYPWFYIKMGSISTWYNSLSDDFRGIINLGHLPFEEFPYLLGKWGKKDLTLIEHPDGRHSLDVDLTNTIDWDSIHVQELERQGLSIGVSSEFGFLTDWDASETLRLEVVEGINITAFGIVGEAGNSGSGGIEL